MKKVKDVLNAKAHAEILSARPNTLVWDAIKLMSDNGIGALVVTDDGHLVGIISERDYLRKVALMGRSSRSTEVREIMTANPFTVTAEESMEACMELMTNKRIRHLPVMEGEVGGWGFPERLPRRNLLKSLPSGFSLSSATPTSPLPGDVPGWQGMFGTRKPAQHAGSCNRIHVSGRLPCHDCQRILDGFRILMRLLPVTIEDQQQYR